MVETLCTGFIRGTWPWRHGPNVYRTSERSWVGEVGAEPYPLQVHGYHLPVDPKDKRAMEPHSCLQQGPSLHLVADPAYCHPGSHFSLLTNRALIWCQLQCAQPRGLI